ncbi:hypothetical protein HanPI659440_Chr13g0502591 [Helianthus annuus]|nr:hypothetical protein HanPI659440_Chr13g0502591 [Helianthus annuus]
MADFEPPSFSLGFDFDQTEETKPPSATNHFGDTDEDFETLTVLDSDSQGQDSVPKLKRLRRGSSVQERVPLDSVERKGGLDCSVVVDDDDIDEFSSQEDEHLSTHRPSVLNSSKFPLNAHGILTKQLGKRKQNVFNDPESVITSCNKPPFPNSTCSPLRRFQLLDSDSDFDDPFISENATSKTFDVSDEPIKLNESVRSTRKDLWEDFPLDKSFNIPTPALDSFCDEYFSSMKDKSKVRSNVRENNQSVCVTSSVIDLGDPRPPAHQYFFHIDPRVQDLVRARLPNFYPLNAANQDSKQPSTSNIDYMGQFCRGETSKQAARTNNAETSSRKNSRKSKAEETSQGFVNQKRGARKEIPKDAGKRRVQADGQAAGIGTGTGVGVGAGAGHWFTNQEGKRVYVSKNGQELTGRAAYMLYKKETGGGFKNKKAKRSSTKKK